MDHLCYLCLVFVMFSRLFIAALWSPAGEGLTSWLLFLMFNCVFVNFPCSTLGQVYYLIVSIPDFLTFIIAAYAITSPKITYTYYTFNFCFLFMKSSMGG